MPDLNFQKDADEVLIAKGTYKARCVYAVDVPDKRHITTRWQIIEDPSGKFIGTEHEEELYYTSPGAMKRLRFCLRALGFQVPDEGNMQLNPNDMIGRTCCLQFDVEQVKGKDNVVRTNPDGSPKLRSRITYDGFYQGVPRGPVSPNAAAPAAKPPASAPSNAPAASPAGTSATPNPVPGAAKPTADVPF